VLTLTDEQVHGVEAALQAEIAAQQRQQAEAERQRQEEARRQQEAESELRSERGVDYTNLQRLLKAQDWREAERETYRLMITTMGKEEGQVFDPEDLLTFPCEDLKTIDGLWVKHSGGKFGFSVQKRVYVECGAKLDGNYPGVKIWHKFYDRVGWRKAGEYVGYKDLQANLQNSPWGEFPKSAVGGWWSLCCLLSHPDL
jgi:hypothetical protein